MVLLKLKSLPGRTVSLPGTRPPAITISWGRESIKKRERIYVLFTPLIIIPHSDCLAKSPGKQDWGGGLIPQWSTGYKLLRANGIMLYFKQSNCLLQKNNYISSFNTENDLPIYVWWEATIFQDIMVETFT